jgi:UDP-3-O-[3-hydroxymyristoyl] N-acetylglucosamine deacetylase
MNLQRTLKREVVLTGIGIHSGKPTRVVLKPARPNRGIVFVRRDLQGCPEIPAHYSNVISTQLATTLGFGQATISTVEHLLAALQCASVDNAVVEVDGPEVPIMDGSSSHFYDAIVSVGLESQLQVRSYLALRKKVELKLGEKWAVAEPASGLEIRGSIEWDHPAIGYQEFYYREGFTSCDEMMRARTFGFVWEVEGLKKMGLAQGASMENAVALNHAAVLNPEGLRCPDEFVKHKVLDALGDFKLAGIAIRASIRLHRAGHDLHYQLLKEIFRDASHYEIVDGNDEVETVISRPRAILVGGYAVG